MAWFAKKKTTGNQKRTLGEGLFRRCEACGETRTVEAFAQCLEICPGCGFHHVIESTIRTLLPEGFQRAEFLLQHGMLDLMAPRPEMRGTLSRILRHLAG